MTASPSSGGSADGTALVARKGELQTSLLLTGQLEAVEAERIVVPRTPSWRVPIRWLAEDGAEVKKGERVLEMDNSQFTGELEQKRLARNSARNQLIGRRAEVRAELADKEFAVERTRIELEKARIKAAVPEEIRPRREYQEDQLNRVRAETEQTKAIENLDATRRSSEASLEELRIAVERAESEIETAEQAIDKLTVTAPGDGILVVSVNRGEGRKFQVGDQAWVGLAVAEIPDLTRMQVMAQLSDVDDGRVAPGMRVSCVLDTYPDREYAGTVVSVAPVANERDRQSLRRSFKVEVALGESDPERMRPGMSAKVVVTPLASRDAVIVPRVALELSGEEPMLRLAGGRDVPVKLGPCNAMECVVLEGVVEGERLRAGA